MALGKTSSSGTPATLSRNASTISSASKHSTKHLQDQHVDLTTEELEQDNANPDSETGKFRQLFGILKKCLNVANLTDVRISLPANLLEPIGNLELWQYCERPDFFAAMPESDDELERMLSVLRWMFTKDLKFVKHKIAKPYNSILGEHFHAHWDIEPISLHPTLGHPEPTAHLDVNPTAEVLSNAGRTTASSSTSTTANSAKTSPKLPSSSSSTSIQKSSTTTTVPASSLKAGGGGSVASSSASTTTSSNETAATSLLTTDDEGKTRTVFLNEQTSHHPPISHFVLEARGPKGTVRATGADQLGAKFTGTTVKVFPGEHNKGIFVSFPDRAGEEYQITHPTANVAGLLRGNPYATICEYTYVTCRQGEGKRRLRAIISYIEESWLLKSKFLVEGVVYEYEEGKEDAYTKIKHVPAARIVAHLEGCWRGEVRWRKSGEKTWSQLLDMVPLSVIPKKVAPLDQQHELETRKVWAAVTNAVLAKDWNTASKAKQTLEQGQRVKAEERKKSGIVYEPRFFKPEGDNWDGRPQLTEDGLKAIELEFKAQYD
ncbi:hypothetical protein T439DRAFT_328927 [Meredithblackwellia eburnea MCA 4105]